MWWIRVGGYAATEIAAHTAPTYETWADGGCGTASWAFALNARSQHQALTLGAPVEVMCGLVPVFAGLLSEPDRTTGECTAFGMASFAKDYLALDAFGNATRDVGVAITTAIAEGWKVSNPGPVAGVVAAGDANGAPVTVAQLLDDYAAQTGQRWGVDAKRRVFMRPDPTTPMWMASPDSAAFGRTSEDRAAKLYARYLDFTSGVFETASVGTGSPQRLVSDLENREAMTRVAAEAYLSGLLERDLSGPAWTNGAVLSRDQIQTVGGTTRTALGQVAAGQMLRAFGLSSSLNAFTTAATIGKTRFTPGSDTIYVEPVNTAPRNLVGVLSA